MIRNIVRRWFSQSNNNEYSKYFAKNSIYHQKDKFLFNPRLQDTKEFIDSDEVIDYKLNQLVKMLQKSNNTVILTGAGISTASGIPDYRSGANTILKTGPGKWELEENKKKFEQEKGKAQKIQAINAFPSKTHMSIAKLYEQKLIKSIITQNVDNLHHQSRISRQDIYELHGNIIAEKCDKCHFTHYRDFYTRQPHLKWGDTHLTGRVCHKNGCDGLLHDTLVFFGESVDVSIKQIAQERIEKAELCIVVGTSLTVQSAARLVWIANKQNIPIAIINLQNTTFDSKALKINGLSELIFDKLLDKLHLKSNPFYLQREITMRFQKMGYSDFDLFVDCESFDGNNLTSIKSIEIWHKNEFGQDKYDKLNEPPFYIQAKDSFNIKKIKLNFYSNLNEKDHFIYDKEELQNGQLFSMSAGGSLIFLKSSLKYYFDESKEWKVQHTIDSYK